MNIPLIGTGKTAEPLANFAKKEQVIVPVDVLSDMKIIIPHIFYWEDVEGGVSYQMTMAFKMFGRYFGMSYEIVDTNVVKIGIMRKKLFAIVKESLDVLVHHGRKVLDAFGNIDPKLVNDEEAIRFRFDPHWDKKVAAFNQLVRVAPITKAKAIELGLLNKIKKYA